MKSYTQVLANFVAETNFDIVPSDIIHQTKRSTLNGLASILAGHITDKGKIAVQMAQKISEKPEATIVGTGYETGCFAAAFANGELCSALDYSEIFMVTNPPVDFVLPAALAMAETVEASGKDFLLAFLLGYEVVTRCALALPQLLTVKGTPPNLEMSFPRVYGFSYSVFGATAAAGKLLGLNPDEMANAFGIAGFSAPVPLLFKFFDLKSMPMHKYAPTGLIAGIGILSALMAKEGYTGDTTVMDGERGFFCGPFATEEVYWDRLTTDLGKEWWISEVKIKPYPSTMVTHIILDLTLKLIEQHKLTPEDIESITAYTWPFLATKSFGTEKEKLTQLGTQFSIPYVLSAAVHRVPITEWHSPKTIKDPRILAFMDKIKFAPEPTFLESVYKDVQETGTYSKKSTSSVEIAARGKKFREHAEYSKGDSVPGFEMTDEELRDKFRTWAYKVLRSFQIERAIDSVFALDKIDNIRKLTALLRP